MVSDDVPILWEWMTLPTAATMLGVSKQTVHNMVAAGRFESVHTLSGPSKRNIYVVRRAEVERMLAEREQAFLERAARAAAASNADRASGASQNPRQPAAMEDGPYTRIVPWPTD